MGGLPTFFFYMSDALDNISKSFFDRVGETAPIELFTDDPLSILRDDPPRIADHCAVVWNLFSYNSVRADRAVAADLNVAEYLGAGPDNGAGADRWMSFARFTFGAAKCYSVINNAVVADLSGLAKNHTRTMIDKYFFADLGPRMDLDPGQETAELGNESWDHWNFVGVKKMSNTMKPDCPDPLVH